ncbi:pentatricopeptide repeat-containing protein [Canna indica]|uniref:Pentatricopeptide repeat-containing protein n=1 Tax=Canna indica TaxID=4628 RepID=A0AAQ3KCK3_9LILI|nr:pentatricopeptide repeat-containing protein [Canna indica]
MLPRSCNHVLHSSTLPPPPPPPIPLSDHHPPTAASITTTTSSSSSWNALIRDCARSPDQKPLALVLYRRMLTSARPDNYTFPTVLTACAFLSAFSEGSQIHAQLLKHGFSDNLYVLNSLIHFYASCGRMPLARKLFDGMRTRSRVSWNVAIDGHVGNGEYDAALSLFRAMQSEFTADEYTLQSVIGACGGVAALSLGMWVHAFVLRKFDRVVADDVLINNSLIDLYAKCGSVLLARQVFDRMPVRDLASWNAMILGLAMHGRIEQCFETFARLVAEDKIRPNSITFVGILSACNHGGLVNDGQRYFNSMVSEFRIEPRIEHYGCMVDLLARSGRISEALDLVSSMPCKPDAVIWRSLLDACSKRNAGVEISESVARQALQSDSADSSGVYVLLSRVYASAKRWNDVGSVRRVMSDEGVKKEPGCSSIEMDGAVHQFVAGDTFHPQSREIYEKLHEVEQRLALAGYMPDSSQAPLVAEQDGVKWESLRLHSERLAIAFGLLTAKPGEPIRVLKNLRVCRDCHAMTKLISRVYNVEIVVRDRIRFHEFKDGSCSCQDYW